MTEEPRPLVIDERTGQIVDMNPEDLQATQRAMGPDEPDHPGGFDFDYNEPPPQPEIRINRGDGLRGYPFVRQPNQGGGLPPAGGGGGGPPPVGGGGGPPPGGGGGPPPPAPAQATDKFIGNPPSPFNGD
ncbi:hypothetical protein EI94DRAFT_1709419 [Lactarius quietus]|nr:hypothetical protein EI94DRAFT_1709419 [Lactarius quietus]